jgi:hypothetical protein
MNSSTPSGILTAILPCNDLDASERFYNRLGFTRSSSPRPPGEEAGYRMLSNGRGGYLHLTDAVDGWLVPGNHSVSISASKTSMRSRPNSRVKSSAKPHRRTNPGACMNSHFPIRTRRWFASAGQPAFADHNDPTFSKHGLANQQDVSRIGGSQPVGDPQGRSMCNPASPSIRQSRSRGVEGVFA